MILQEFIPGDDTFMRVMTNYSGAGGQVRLMCVGHVLLEEHTPHGSGNHAVILNEPCGPFAEKIRAFLEAIGFVGFSNFDIKYDRRDGKFKAFEINCRQGRGELLRHRRGPQHRQAPGGGPGGEERSPPSSWRTGPASGGWCPGRWPFTYIVSDYHQPMRELMRQGKGGSPPCSTTRTSP